MRYNITPVPKPRMTRSDKWKKRPCVLRYWAFRDEVRLKKVILPESGAEIIFHMPMPNSWTGKRKEAWNGTPHRRTPDLDNLIKALGDAIYSQDKHMWNFKASKIWAYEGGIEIK
jgi:Holliday junction resolvase RusA-like endonuclease